MILSKCSQHVTLLLVLLATAYNIKISEGHAFAEKFAWKMCWYIYFYIMLNLNKFTV